MWVCFASRLAGGIATRVVVSRLPVGPGASVSCGDPPCGGCLREGQCAGITGCRRWRLRRRRRRRGTDSRRRLVGRSPFAPSVDPDLALARPHVHGRDVQQSVRHRSTFFAQRCDRGSELLSPGNPCRGPVGVSAVRALLCVPVDAPLPEATKSSSTMRSNSRLAHTGRSVEAHFVAAMPHAWVTLDADLPETHRAIAAIASFIRSAIAA